MIRLLLILSVLLAVGTADGQVLRSYEQLGGHFSAKVIRSDGGLYIPVRPVAQEDTLWMWIEEATPQKAPSREAARMADLVVWCYPERYSDKRHVMPEAERTFVVQHQREGKDYLVVGPAYRLAEVLPGARVEGGMIVRTDR